MPTVLQAADIPDLNPTATVRAIADAFRALHRGRVIQPPQSVHPLDDGGDVITYPTVNLDTGNYALKVSPYLPQPDGSALVTAWTLLFDLRTGVPSTLMDSRVLTTLRTAATTAVAVDKLTTQSAYRLSVVGSGPMALAHIEHLRAIRSFDVVKLHSTRHLHDAPPGVEVVVGLDGIEDADVVALCTSAAQPVLDTKRVRAGTVITSISTNAPGAHEVSPRALTDLDVYVDHRSSLTTAAEFVRATTDKTWNPAATRGDLAELVNDAAPLPTGDRVVYFRSIGLGLEDAAIAELVLRTLDR